jgi:hypothetical protein
MTMMKRAKQNEWAIEAALSILIYLHQHGRAQDCNSAQNEYSWLMMIALTTWRANPMRAWPGSTILILILILKFSNYKCKCSAKRQDKFLKEIQTRVISDK